MPVKPIRYSAHLLGRLALRNIAMGLPVRLIREAERRFVDEVTGYKVAIAVGEYRWTALLMAVVYEETEVEIIVVTIHPLSEAVVLSKLRSGRWK